MCCSVESGNIVYLKLKSGNIVYLELMCCSVKSEKVGHVFEIDVFSGKLKYITFEIDVFFNGK